MNNSINKLFIILSKQLVSIHEKGLFNCDTFDTGNIKVNIFLNLALKLAKDGYGSDIIESELSFIISKHILNRDIDEITLHSMEIIKNSIQPIISINYEFLISYAKRLCTESVINEMQDDIIFKSINPS